MNLKEMALTLKWTKKLSIWTPVLLFIAILMMGGGHGMFEPAIILFPFGLIGILFSRGIELPFVFLAILQYPIYGLLIDTIGNRASLKWTVLCITTIHIVLAGLILTLRGENWI
jgi:hypothetical protein